MTRVKDFDKKSETARWLFAHIMTYIPKDAWDGPAPDFDITINGVEVDVNEFFDFVADAMDAEIERKVNKGAAIKANDILGGIESDMYDIRMEFRQKILDILGLDGERVFWS